MIIGKEKQNVGFGFSRPDGSREENEGKAETRRPARTKKIESHEKQSNWKIDFVEALFQQIGVLDFLHDLVLAINEFYNHFCRYKEGSESENKREHGEDYAAEQGKASVFGSD